MKPSHVVSIMLAALGVGGMSSAAVSSPSLHQSVQQSSTSQKIAWLNTNKIADALVFDMKRGGTSVSAHPCSWRKKNQRQIRLARRRLHAAGHKKAFV